MFTALLATHFIHVALLAGVIIAVLCGVTGPYVIARRMAFAVHGTAELGLTGAAAGLLLGVAATTGALVGSITVGVVLGVLGLRGRDRDTTTGVVLGAGLGFGVLFLSLSRRYATSGFGLLFGDITAVSDHQLKAVAAIALGVGLVLLVIGRPLWFASIDAEAAQARGVPVRLLTVVFPILLAVVVAETIQVTGVLLILTLVITPAAAAAQLTAQPSRMLTWSVAICVCATVGGILLSLVKSWPPSFFVAVLSFAAYLVARLASPLNRPFGSRRRVSREPSVTG
jgi:zinc/manganese transport system permease protein